MGLFTYFKAVAASEFLDRRECRGGGTAVWFITGCVQGHVRGYRMGNRHGVGHRIRALKVH